MNIQNECWNCNTPYHSFKYFCNQCKKILKPILANAFEHFDIKPDISIDLNQLEMNYYEIQVKIHPDKFVGLSNEESLYAQIHSSNLNNSYQILKNIVSRCDELLKISGIESSNETTISDPEVLNEVMTIQEKLESINDEDRKVFMPEIKEKLKIYIESLELAFKIQDFEKLKVLKTKITYYEKVIKDLR
tara:strand:- start:2004 stop:2573 length:570 start_codon:yes stop_codon:yes gene_type:complete